MSNVLSKVRRGDAYPSEHEDRAAQTFEKALLAAAATSLSDNNNSNNNEAPTRLKVLEVGIGSNCRTFQRGYYNSALQSLHSSSLPSLQQGLTIDFVGVDLEIPTSQVLQQARDTLVASADRLSILPSSKESRPPLLLTTTLNVLSADIVQGLPFPNNHFDCITCSLVLCSVTDPNAALQEMKRILRPGGTFGFVEHVAVDLNQEVERMNYRGLEWQQRTLDPLQQLVAHNCHLHRRTEEDIQRIFVQEEGGGYGGGVVEETQRFFVKDMWPVSCQCCGVVQKLV